MFTWKCKAQKLPGRKLRGCEISSHVPGAPFCVYSFFLTVCKSCSSSSGVASHSFYQGVENHKLQRTNGHRHYASIHGNYKNISMLLQKEGNQRWAGPAVGCTLGTCSLLQSPREAGGDLPGLMRLLIERCAAKLQVAMKLLGAQLSSILSLGEKGRGVRCLRGARSRSSSSQNTLSMSAENHHCTVAHCGLRRQQGAQFLPWHLVSPLHTCQAGMMRNVLAEPSLLSPPAH